MKQINHGIPKHEFFGIAVPHNSDQHSPIVNGQKPQYKLVDPKSKESITAEAWGAWKFPLDDLPEALIRLVYGFPAETVKAQLKRKHPELELNPNVSIILMKRINK